MSDPIRYYLEAEIARATSRRLHDPEYWAQLGIPMPERYQDFTIPASIRKEREPDAEPSPAMRIIGREICADTKRYDERELRRAYNRREDK